MSLEGIANEIIKLLKELIAKVDQLLGIATPEPTPTPPPGPTPTPNPGPPPQVVWWMNETGGIVADGDCTKIVEALNLQLADLEKAWTLAPPVTHAFGSKDEVPAGAVKAYLLPDSDTAGALGYHDEDPLGDPYIRVFVNPTLQNGGTVLSGPNSVAVTCSHEGCEEAVDPSTQSWSLPETDGTKVALETCDACEASGYDVTLADGSTVTVSDFLFPAFFQPDGQAPFDQMRLVTAPFQTLPGGYQIVQDPSGTVSQVFGERYPEWKKATKLHPAARTARRLRLPRLP